MHQTAIQVDISAQEVSREKSLGGAIALCAKAAGLEAKQLQDQLHLDKAQFSRWESGGEGIMWPKLVALMDACGNDAPLLWMLHARGYDLHSVRKLESETEAQNRLLREEVAALRRVLLASKA